MLSLPSAGGEGSQTDDLKYAEHLNFVQLRIGNGRGVLWPCLLFPSKEELRHKITDIVKKVGHTDRKISKRLLHELEQHDYLKEQQQKQEMYDEKKDMEKNNALLAGYLLGVELPVDYRLVILSSSAKIETFQSQYKLALQGNSKLVPGFQEALKEALQLMLGKEFNKARLRFSLIEQDEQQTQRSSSSNSNKKKNIQVVSWPCILFDDYHLFLQGLKRRGLLTTKADELRFAREYINVAESESLPPYVYYFGNKPEGRLVGGLEYDQAIGNAIIDQQRNKDFWNALQEAIRSVSEDPMSLPTPSTVAPLLASPTPSAVAPLLASLARTSSTRQPLSTPPAVKTSVRNAEADDEEEEEQTEEPIQRRKRARAKIRKSLVHQFDAVDEDNNSESSKEVDQAQKNKVAVVGSPYRRSVLPAMPSPALHLQLQPQQLAHHGLHDPVAALDIAAAQHHRNQVLQAFLIGNGANTYGTDPLYGTHQRYQEEQIRRIQEEEMLKLKKRRLSLEQVEYEKRLAHHHATAAALLHQGGTMVHEALIQNLSSTS